MGRSRTMRWRDLMSELAEPSAQPAHLAEMVADARDAVPSLVAQIVTDIRVEVPAYAGREHGERQRVIAMAVTAAAHQFLDTLLGPTKHDPNVFRLFRDMGYGEAQDGNTLEPMRRALRIATRHSWRLIHRVVTAHALDTAFLGRLGDALFAYLDLLDQEVARGHVTGLTTAERADEPSRDRLLAVLLDDSPESDARTTEIAAEAAHAEWPLPDQVVVMRVSYHGHFPTVPLEDSVLVDQRLNPAVLVVSPSEASAVAERVSRGGPGVRVAVSWPVAPTGAAAADRWARRTLDLVAAGVIEPQLVVRCVEHMTQLWLHSEPLLRRSLVLQLLPPLLNETNNSREILAETMLAWLESRDSAPAIAARLNVHPQTVRYRWKRINELFGDLLHDPEFVITVTMLLKATVPMWKAGDTSDVDRYLASNRAS